MLSNPADVMADERSERNFSINWNLKQHQRECSSIGLRTLFGLLFALEESCYSVFLDVVWRGKEKGGGGGRETSSESREK